MVTSTNGYSRRDVILVCFLSQGSARAAPANQLSDRRCFLNLFEFCLNAEKLNQQQQLNLTNRRVLKPAGLFLES